MKSSPLFFRVSSCPSFALPVIGISVGAQRAGHWVVAQERSDGLPVMSRGVVALPHSHLAIIQCIRDFFSALFQEDCTMKLLTEAQ